MAEPVEELAWKLCRGAQEDYVRELSERMASMLEQGIRSPDRYAVLASRSRVAAMDVWATHKDAVTEEARIAFLEALEASDREIVDTLSTARGASSLTARGHAELTQAARGMAQIIARDNVSFADGQADIFNAAVSEAITRYEMGDDYREVMEQAVRRMSSLEMVDYKSGVHSQVDVLIRRHITTQAEQARVSGVMGRCAEFGHDLVMIDAHYGARPSHAEWQGKVYSISGKDKRYPSLRDATGYGTASGFAGANCRHFATPYVEGLSQIPDVTKGWEEKYGMSSDEFYQQTQKQRALERKVRALKRSVSMGQERGLDMADDRYRLGDAQAKLRDHCARYGLQRDYERERAYGVAQQPASLGSGHITQSYTQFMASPFAQQRIRDSSLTVRAGEDAIRSYLDEKGIGLVAFSHLPETKQQAIARSALRAEEHTQRQRALKRIHSGELPLTIDESKQKSHMAGTKERQRRLDKGEHPGLIYGDSATAQELVNTLYADKDSMFRFNGGQVRETCGTKDHRMIGETWDIDRERFIPTDRLTIHWSKTGTHVVPAAPSSNLKRR